MNLKQATELATARITQTMADIEEERQERSFQLGLTPDNAQSILDAIDLIKESRNGTDQ